MSVSLCTVGSSSGGITNKFQEFNSSGTFTPPQALIDAGGYIEVFLVAGGGKSAFGAWGGSGGETILKQMYLTSTTSLPVVIGAGATTGGNNGGNSTFNGITATGGNNDFIWNNRMGAGWGGSTYSSAGNGVLGYGAGGAKEESHGVNYGKNNSGQGASVYGTAGSGYCLIKWYE
jgi:hypothetical protein